MSVADARPRWNLKILAPWVITDLAILWAAWTSIEHAILGIHESFAVEQATIFEEIRSDSLVSGRLTPCEALEYTVRYYPSGTKQVTGSRLDQLVERQRQAVIRELIARLRETSGKDLRDDPQAWLDEHCRVNSSDTP